MWIERPITVEEVKEALSSLMDDKAPGLDGFLVEFLKVFWEVLEGDIMGVIFEFFQKASLCRSVNATFLMFIPKLRAAKELKNFRPISLLGCFYKLLAKVLSRRLEGVMSSIISASQSADIRRRQILDCSLLANECIDEWMRNGQARIVVQLDMEKAYDHVHWVFLLDLLREMGFGQVWCNWIKTCIFSVSISVLLNGSSEDFFKSSRGL